MAISPRPQVELEKTYNAAADHYDHPAVSFWDRYGRRTVDRLPIISGMAVLDVCCGMGASAIPAAERVDFSLADTTNCAGCQFPKMIAKLG
jgi:ubiquinone/menaquinone biosynthesis C-methylase UbiE